MGKILIIGAGPAGTSAALYARRAGLDVTVLYKDSGALGKTDLIENYYGFPRAIGGEELFLQGMEGAKRLGVEYVKAEVLAITMEIAGFSVETTAGTCTADSVILAAGASRKTLPLSGLKELEGKGVSYCAVCDAFFYRQKRVAVIGAGEYALHEAEVLAPHASEVHIFTDGVDPEIKFPESYILHKERLAAIPGEGRVAGVTLKNGETIPLEGVFLAIGTAGATELARKLGAMLAGANVKVDENMATNVPGFFAAGDCTGGLLQLSKAVFEGSKAGLSAAKFVRGKK